MPEVPLSMVAICGASASQDSVRRAIWLPREPDSRHPLRSAIRVGRRPGMIALTQQDGYVLVHGESALALEREWLAFSADRCRVLALRLPAGQPGVRWALYEEGRRSRLYDELAGIDEGERRPFEPVPGKASSPSATLCTIYTALTDSEVGKDLDLDAEVGVWFVDP